MVELAAGPFGNTEKVGVSLGGSSALPTALPPCVIPVLVKLL